MDFQGSARLNLHNFPRIHNIFRIKCLFELSHYANCIPVLFDEETNFPETDAMLPGSGATHGKRAVYQALI